MAEPGDPAVARTDPAVTSALCSYLAEFGRHIRGGQTDDGRLADELLAQLDAAAVAIAADGLPPQQRWEALAAATAQLHAARPGEPSPAAAPAR